MFLEFEFDIMLKYKFSIIFLTIIIYFFILLEQIKGFSHICFILFESAKKYLKDHLGESKSLTISKWKSEVTALKKEKDSLYSQIIDLRKEVEKAESVRSCIEQLQQENRELLQVKKQELDL